MPAQTTAQTAPTSKPVPDPFLLTAAEKRAVATSSIERMINTTMHILESTEVQKIARQNEALGELVSINHQDWEELKWIAVKLWNRERDQNFKEDLDLDLTLAKQKGSTA